MAIEPRLLKGFRDHLPADMLARQHMINTIAQAVQTFGFSPIETPTLEYADILLGKLGDEGEKLLYQFKDHGDRQVAMRYDLTVPLARVIAQYPELPKPFKRYQVGPVWRADNTQRGRYREFYQFDIDSIGSDSQLAEAEILVVMQQILLSLGLTNFTIRINDRHWLSGLADRLALTDQQRSVFYLGLDKWDKIGGQSGVEAYWQEQGLTANQCQQLLTLLQVDQHHPAQVIIDLAVKLGLNPKLAQIDPTIVRGLDYYTGIVFETTLIDAPQYGSVLSGGRYDNLIGTFAKQSIPAVGTSVGIDRLFAALEELGLLPSQTSVTQVLVTQFDQQTLPASLQAVKQLRLSGIHAELYYEPGNLGKQLKYADALGIPLAIIIGEDELSNGQATVRQLSDRTEHKVAMDQLPEYIQAKLGK